MSSSVAEPLQAPFQWFGGKRWIAPQVWERLGDPGNFVEPFFGSGAVLLARPHASGTETVNDADAHLCNFWRAVQVDPEAVAAAADWPVSELDLHARHLWLVNEGRRRVEQLRTDPEYFDVQAAGWWVWGLCQWIGSGWCSGKGPLKLPGELGGDAAQLPHLGDAGQGVHRKLPHLGDAGRGIHRPALPEVPGTVAQLPHLGNAGRGGHRARHREALLELFAALQARLRGVRICCGDWTRVLGPSVTDRHGLTGIFLDPPYPHADRHDELYATETDCAAAVREWAVAHGENPVLRIVLCGYAGQPMPRGWEEHRWKARGGFGSQGNGRGRENCRREVLWFSPACLRPTQARLNLEDAA